MHTVRQKYYDYTIDSLHTDGPGMEFDTVEWFVTRVSGGVEIQPIQCVCVW